MNKPSPKEIIEQIRFTKEYKAKIKKEVMKELNDFFKKVEGYRTSLERELKKANYLDTTKKEELWTISI
jgi:hypothetical protein